MKNYIKRNMRLWVSAIMVLCAAVASAQTTGATLTVADIEAAAGKEVSVPVYLSNAEKVVGVQFDVELPYALTSAITMSENRKDGHTVSRKSIGTNKYRVTVMSFSNNAIKGNSGLLLRLPMTVAEEAQADDTFDMTLTNIVLAKADGTNIATAAEHTATFTVQRVPTPDLIVSEVTVDATHRTLIPGDKLRVSYEVTNQGNAETGAGWTENIYLVDVMGARTFVNKATYSNTLTAGTVLNRYVEVDIPQVMRIDGDVTVYVELVGNKQTGELIADQGNNSAMSDDVCVLAKKLFLTPDNAKISEGSTRSYTLTRSGDWSMDETYTLEGSDEGVLGFPETVVIKAGNSGVSFRVKAVEDDEVSTLTKTYLTVAAANGYDAVKVGILLSDNDDYPLTLTADKTQITEGDVLTLTVERGGPLDEELKVNISCNQASRMTTLRAITIPAGEAKASATVSVKENLTPQSNVTVTYTAQKNEYMTSKVEIPLIDGDRPNLTLKLSTDVVSESDGYGALMATVTRDGDLSENLNIFVDNSSNGEVYFDSDRYTISAGSSSVTFPIGVTDNSIIEGTRTYKVWAAVYLTDVKKADETTKDIQTFDVADNDAHYIRMESRVAAIQEGGKATVTISHNDMGSKEEVVVNLSVDDAAVTIPPTVTIAAGKTSVTFDVNVATNEIADDEHTFTIKAESMYGDATMMFMISDRTLPDYTVKRTTLISNNVSPNRECVWELEIENKGLVELPAEWPIKVYLADHSMYVERLPYWTTKMLEIDTWYTTEAIAAGESKVMTFVTTVPANFDYSSGLEYFKTWSNRPESTSDYHNSNELSLTNNEPNGVWIDIVRPYTVTSIKTDKDTYMPGDVATLKGMVAGGREGDIVEVYFYNASGDCVKAKATVAIDATFELQQLIGANWGGEYKIGGRGIGEHEYVEQTSIGVYNLEVNGGKSLEWKIAEGDAKTGMIRVTNQSGLAIHNVRICWEEMPQDCEFEVSNAIAVLEPGATANFTYKVTPTATSTGGDYLKGKLTATCNEGISKSVNTYYYCTKSRAEVIFEKDKVETTLMHGTTRSYEVRFGNVGLAETGNITIETPTTTPWLGFSTPSTISTLDGGETSSIMLTLTWQKDMIASGTYESFVRVKPENGAAKVLPIIVTIVSNEKATLTIDAVDVYTKGAEDGNGPHLSGATVKLVNKMTGDVAMTGTTDTNGLWTTKDLTEGVYDLYVSADRHQTYKETIVVSPGEVIVKEAFLPYAAVKVTYTVVETEVVDEYETRIEMVFVPDIPQAIVIPEGMNFGCGGTTTATVKLTNKGKLTAYNPTLLFPKLDDVTFTVLNEYPEVLYPGESYDMKVQFEGPDNVYQKMGATVIMHYEYKLQGNMYANNDGHVAEWGCEDYPIVLGGGAGGYSEPKGQNGGLGDIFQLSEFEDKDEEGMVSLPTYTPISTSKTNQVVLEFRQTFFLTRQAFRGTLKIENQYTTGLTDIVFEANVKTMDGKDVTEMFALDYDDKPTGSIEVDKKTGVWSLAGEKVGEAGVIYVPSKETAPTEPVTYLFGGTLMYTDIDTGERVIVELMQTALKVNPSPDLYLTYFIQREFISDDPLTDVVEPWEPAEFALLIQNKGAGKALNLAIETSEPRIIENVNSLPVAFKSLYSSIDGVEGNFPFTYMKVGAIEPGQNVLARWFFYSNVSGYVNDYYAEMVRGSIYGEEFNLITLLGARDLKRSVKSVPQATALATPARGVDMSARAAADIFLLDEIEDEENLPDCLIDSDGNETTDLEIVNESTTVNKVNENTYELKVKTTRPGWVYGKLHDPTNGTMLLSSVVRGSDDVNMGVNNFWQTDRSIAKDRSTVYENLLHFADYMYDMEEIYILTFVDKPAKPVTITTVEGIPEMETSKAVTQVKVLFDKEIDATTFTAEDIVITCNGTQLDLGQASITKKNSVSYVVDWSNLAPMYGTYQIVIYTSGITDVDGLNGETSVMKSWTQKISGKVQLDVVVTPDEAGMTTASGVYEYGYVTLKAEAKEGYVFYRWTEDGKVLSTADSYTYLLYKPTTIKAEFVPATYALTVTCNENFGGVSGAASGTYEYGTEMTLCAVPNSGYIFAGWKVNGIKQENTDAVLSLVMKQTTTVEALFDKAIITLLMGDVNNDEKVSVTDISITVSHIMNENPLNFVFVKGDMNGDGNISVTDITHIVSKIMNGETTLPTFANTYQRSKRVPQMQIDDVIAHLNEEVIMPISFKTVENDYIACQMDVVLPIGMDLSAIRMNDKLKHHAVSYAKIEDNTYRILVYSMGNARLDVYDDMVELVVRPIAVAKDAEYQTLSVTNIQMVDAGLFEQRISGTTAKVGIEVTGIDDSYVEIVVKGGKHLIIRALQEQQVAVYGMDGRVVAIVQVKVGVNAVSLDAGIYMVGGKKIVIN